MDQRRAPNDRPTGWVTGRGKKLHQDTKTSLIILGWTPSWVCSVFTKFRRQKQNTLKNQTRFRNYGKNQIQTPPVDRRSLKHLIWIVQSSHQAKIILVRRNRKCMGDLQSKQKLQTGCLITEGALRRCLWKKTVQQLTGIPSIVRPVNQIGIQLAKEILKIPRHGKLLTGILDILFCL